MDSKQSLYYAMGVMAYGVAKADGVIQNEEKEALHQIVLDETEHNMDFQYVEIIFKILQRDKPGFDEIRKWATDALEMGKYHLTDKIKEQFVNVLKKVADAFPPKTSEEHEMINEFIQYVRAIKVNLPLD